MKSNFLNLCSKSSLCFFLSAEEHAKSSNEAHLIAAHGERRVNRVYFYSSPAMTTINFLSQPKLFLRWQIECGLINTEAFTSCKRCWEFGLYCSTQYRAIR